MSKTLIEKIRDEETDRIVEVLRGMNSDEGHIYMTAYADALNYVHNFLKPEEREEQDEYLT